MFIENIRKCLS